MTRRYLFVRLPFFAIQRHIKQEAREHSRTKPYWDTEAQADGAQKMEPKGPLVLVTHSAKGTRISALGSDGIAQGFWSGMKLNDARAMMPEVRVTIHDITADRLLQNRLAHWMLRYSPSVALHDKDGFILNVAGCTHLFGGEAAMADDIQKRFAAMGYDCRLAFADTLGAALALVSYGAGDVHILPSNAAEDALDTLPVEALRLEDETLVTLKRLGLKRIGDVRRLPRKALERRFRENKKTRSKVRSAGLAQSVQWRLDHLTGQAFEPLDWIVEPQAFRATKQCPELALEVGAVEIALRELLPNLCTQLKVAGMGARQFRLTGYRADDGASTISAMLSHPAHDAPAIARLFKDRFELIDCGFGIDLFVLEALQTSVIKTAQCDGFDPDNRIFSSASLAGFADTMINRGNGSQVLRLAPHQSHVPERAQNFVPINIATDWNQWQKAQPVWSPRPLRMFARPEPAQVTAELPDSPPVQFIWRKRLRKVIRSRGPERILPEWWHDDLKAKRSATYRDYYDVEDETGLRYWIFRSIKDEKIQDSDDTHRTTNWFVHGLF